MKNYYMHLLNNRPAKYTANDQITFVGNYQKVSFDGMFVDSLEKIKAQQKASTNWRRKQGMSSSLDEKYGYLRIRVYDTPAIVKAPQPVSGDLTIIESPLLPIIKALAENNKNLSPALQDVIAKFLSVETMPKMIVRSDIAGAQNGK